MGVAGGEGGVVQCGDDGMAAVRELAEEIQHLQLVLRIEMIGRLSSR